ncbi:MAG: SpoIIIAH-like family protein [Clostridia bacterium]|nr:SpoIIIAH-like family protein [Clostridia bacterium]
MKNIFKSKFFSRVGRRNLVIISIVLLLGLAVFVNYRWFYDPTKDIGYGENNMNQGQSAGQQNQDNNTPTDYFASADVSRKSARDEALEVLQNAVDNPTSDTDVAGALAQIARIAEDIENEANIETLILAKGFEKCIAVISGDSASVVVSCEEGGLLPTQVAQISTIVYEQAGILPDRVTIIEK